MKKILIICIIIVVSIVLGDILLQKYVDTTFDNMIAKLNDIDNSIDNKDESEKKIKELDDMWEENFKRMACYLEHIELEKVKTQIILIKAGIESDDVKFVHEEVERAIYIIDHIKEKETLRIDNIF